MPGKQQYTNRRIKHTEGAQNQNENGERPSGCSMITDKDAKERELSQIRFHTRTCDTIISIVALASFHIANTIFSHSNF